MKTLLVTFCALFIGIASASAQKQFKNPEESSANILVEEPASKQSNFDELLEELKGTFSIYLTDSQHAMALTYEHLIGIKEGRKLNEDFKIVIDPKTYIFIPSLATINSNDFSPLEMVTYTFNN